MKLEDKYEKIIIGSLFVATGVLSRLLDHDPNFTAVGAVALMAGIYFSPRAFVFLILALLGVNDFFLGFYQKEIMFSVYGSFLLMGLLGQFFKKPNILKVAGLSLAGALIFFVVTNFSVWYFGLWYAKDLTGLARCYVMALPFFRNTLISNIFYSVLIYGTLELYLLLKPGFKRSFKREIFLIKNITNESRKN